MAVGIRARAPRVLRSATPFARLRSASGILIAGLRRREGDDHHAGGHGPAAIVASGPSLNLHLRRAPQRASSAPPDATPDALVTMAIIAVSTESTPSVGTSVVEAVEG